MQQGTQWNTSNLIGLGKNIIRDLIPLGNSFKILKQALYMIFQMTAPIKFELSPRGTLIHLSLPMNTYKISFLMDQVITLGCPS